MGTSLRFEYDSVGDILYVDIAPPHDKNIMREVAEGVLLRMNLLTEGIDGLEVHGFMARLASGSVIEAPILAAFTQPAPAIRGA